MAAKSWFVSLREENLELKKLLKSIEFGGLGRRKCPVCAGWEVVPGNGECSEVHTKNCPLAAAIKDLNTEVKT